jgi:cytosine/adenosine deaminase-related metal-dependent hydrolase
VTTKNSSTVVGSEKSAPDKFVRYTSNEITCSRSYVGKIMEYLDKIGFLDENCILAHSIWLDDKEIKMIQ